MIYFWEHGNKKLKSFIGNINNVHPTINITIDWSKRSINFLDVKLSVPEGIIETDSHQYFLSSSCHPFYFKKDISYSQALRLNRICSNNEYFDERCNDLRK